MKEDIKNTGNCCEELQEVEKNLNDLTLALQELIIAQANVLFRTGKLGTINIS